LKNVNWQTEWKAICALIEEQLAAAESILQVMRINSGDEWGLVPGLIANVNHLREKLTAYVKHYDDLLPEQALRALKSFLSSDVSYNSQWPLSGVGPIVTGLRYVRASVNYYISDFDEVMSRRTERALTHLQQTIVVSEEVQRMWVAAFKKDEPKCEMLGAVHLLSHGIYAFKVDGGGAKTDLVCSDPIRTETIAGRDADALVLTEWKVAKPVKGKESLEIEAKAHDARNQMAIYAAGVLGGIELVSYRYVVIVSETRQAMPPVYQQNGVTYVHRNIAVNPGPPSKEARRTGSLT
jgi:hypothetical protein